MDRLAAGTACREIVELLARGLIVTKRLVQKGAIALLAQARKQRRNRTPNIADQSHRKRRTIAKFFAADVYLHDLCVSWIELPVREIGAQHQQDIAAEHRVIT